MELGSMTLQRIGFFVFQLNTQHTLSFFVFRSLCEWFCSQKNLAAEKSRVISATDNGVSTRIGNGAI
jgi:hypothetical protein